MPEPSTNHRVAITIAVIGVLGTLGAALIGNWDKIFSSESPTSTRPRPTQSHPQPSAITQSPAPTPTTVLRSTQDQVIGYNWVSDGPGLIVFEVDYTYDRAHSRPMFMQVTLYSEPEGPADSGKPKLKVIARGLSDRLAAANGKVRVDARKLLDQPTASRFVEIVLLEEAVPVSVKQFPIKRRWGPA
jgi:hypothetical protein